MQLYREYFRRPSKNIFPLAGTYEIGFFVLIDQLSEEIIGKITFSGNLLTVVPVFTPFVTCRPDAMSRFLRVNELFDLEQDDWYGKVSSLAGNYVICDRIRLPVFLKLGQCIGFIHVAGRCDKMVAVFVPSVSFSVDRFSDIFVTSKVSTRKPRTTKPKTVLKIFFCFINQINDNYFMLVQFIIILVDVLGTIVPVLVGVAYLTLLERKVLASIQRRFGPDQVGFLGLLQPISDAAKLIFKETILPSTSNKFLFIFAPVFSFVLSISFWAVVPFGPNGAPAEFDLSIFYLLAISSLGVYSLILAGWASSSKYAFFGALRSAAQMISYEVSFSFALLPIFICCGTFNLTQIVEFQEENVWFVVPMFPLFFIFFTSSLAETNRPPFDLPEAESELVAGYNVDYSSSGFALFFISEYSNIILLSSLNVICFFGGWANPINFFSILPSPFVFAVKVTTLVLLFIWIRGVVPRYRYDQLMYLNWKTFIPLTTMYVVLSAIIVWVYLFTLFLSSFVNSIFCSLYFICQIFFSKLYFNQFL